MIDPFKFTILSSRPVGQRCIAWVKDTSNPDDRYLYTNAPEEAGIVISVMYDKLLTEEFIMDRRCYNFHPGLLPQQRGSGAFSWAIINGEECGITLHQLDVGMDTGPIIDQMVIAQGDTWTAEQLHDRGMELMLEMFKN